MTTTHAYTGDQRLIAALHHARRPGRTAGLKTIPATTEAPRAAAEEVRRAFAELAGGVGGATTR